MNFYMNDLPYIIKEVDEIEILNYKNEIAGDGHYLGLFTPTNSTIYINTNLSEEQKRKTLIHELTHCYIWSYCTQIEQLNEDDLCNINANSFDIIYEILDGYFNV